MKLIKMIIVLIFVTSLCKSQTILDPPSILGSLDQSVLNTEVNDFKRGWNWVQPNKRLDLGLLFNCSHGAYQGNPITGTPNMNYIDQIPGFSAGHPNYAKLNSMAVLFDPAIKVYTTSAYYPPTWDTKGAIYGFIDKNTNLGTVDSTPGTDNFHRYVLTKQPNMSETKVLSNSWPQDSTFWLLDYSNSDDKELLTNLDVNTIVREGLPTLYRNDYPLNGTRWYLSVNLKSTENISLTESTQTVLKIKLKYTLKDGTNGYINFNKIPMQGIPSIVNLYSSISGSNSFRGLTRQDSVLSAPIDYFPITNRMIRTNSTGNNNTDITLSAYFYAREKFVQDNQSLWPFLNPYFEPEALWQDFHNTSKIQNLNYINKLEVEVWYCGKLNCAIDWVKIETEQAKQLLTGQYDQEFVDACQTLLANTKNTTLNNKIHRFYVFDEFLRPYMSAIRYSNQLLGGNAQSEFEFSILPSLRMIDHALGLREYWNGNSVAWGICTASPYYSYGISNWTATSLVSKGCLGTLFGRDGIKNYDNNNHQFYEEIRFDSLNSGYETFLGGGDWSYCRYGNGYHQNRPQEKLLPSQSNWNDDSLNTLYNTKDTQDSHRYLIPFGSLYNIEKQLFKLYYQKDALFVGKPIYFNLWVTSEAWFYYKDLADTNKSLAFLGSQSLRPLTDSEFKLTSNMPLILGIKGLFYWLKTGFNWNKSTPLEYKDPDYPNTVAIQTTENMNNPDSINPSLTGLDYILDNGLGDDYMVPYNDPNFSYHYKPNDHYQYSFLGIDQNHVFLGTRSLRYEMYKLHKYITDNESLLKNLSLTCWYAKGHRKWYVQNPNISIDSVMKNYVDFNNVKTRKLFQPNYPDGGYVPLDFEPYEDRFFDLTILQLNGKPITSEFYLGIQNRRTDKSMWVGGLNTPWRLSYVPSAEFDDLCDGPDAPYWRGMYPYELGNRELSIPLKFSHTTIGNRIGYLAQEITYNFPKESSTEFSHMRYFFKDAYYHKFQGVYLTNFYHIISTDTMLIKLHPGQSR